jgi:NADH-quinone oxidoreductase subunit L
VVPEADEEETGFIKLLSKKYYIDEIYAALITRPLDKISTFSYKYIERGIIDRSVNNLGYGLNGLSGLLRYIQTGNIGSYVFSMVIGIILLIALTLIF